MTWFVENAEDAQKRRAKQRPRQRKGMPKTYGRLAFREFAELLARKGDSLQDALGVKVGRILGCGKYGCVIGSRDGKVLKLSPLPQNWESQRGGVLDEELAFWTKMWVEQRRPASPASEGVVKIEHVWVITDKDTGLEYMAVLRDDVEPFVSVRPDPESPAGRQWVILDPSETSQRHGVKEIPSGVLMPEDLEYYGVPVDERAIEGLLWAVNEYDLHDVHLGNVGWEGDRLVVYDADYDEDDAPSPESRLRVNVRKPYDPFDLDSKSVAEELDERARKAEQGDWYPAHGGKEQPFRTRSGRRLQYVYQPSTGRHAYYDVDSDLILSDEEAEAFLPNADADFDPKSVVTGDRLITPQGEEITVTRVLRERGATWIFFFSPGHVKFQAALGLPPAEDAKEFRRASDREGWQHAPNDKEQMQSNPRVFHVFEMQGNEPLRQVNVEPLSLTKAKQLARIGAEKGKHARTVTTDPRKEPFRIVARYGDEYGDEEDLEYE